MAYKVFADANVYLDFLMQRGADWQAAEDLFIAAEQKRVDVYTSASNLLNIIYVMGTHKVSRTDIVSYVNAILSCTTLANPTNEVFSAALTSGFRDIEDAVQYFTAMGIPGIDYFITSNSKDYKKATAHLPVLTPGQFIKLYWQEG